MCFHKRCQFVFFIHFLNFPGKKPWCLDVNGEPARFLFAFELLRHPFVCLAILQSQFSVTQTHYYLTKQCTLDTLVNMFVCVWYLVSEHYMNSWFQVPWPQVQNEMKKSILLTHRYISSKTSTFTYIFFKVSISH